MSASVIRRGLELFSEKDGEKHKERKKSGSHKNQMSCNKQRVHRQMRPSEELKRVKSRNTVKDKHIRSALDEYRKKQKKSQLTSNLQYFLGADYKTQTSHTKKIVQQNSGRRSCHQPDLPVSRPEEKSVFTEEEFQKFQEEFFSNL